MNSFPFVMVLLLGFFVQEWYFGTVNANDKMTTTDKSIEDFTHLFPVCGSACSGGTCPTSVALFHGAVVIALARFKKRPTMTRELRDSVPPYPY
uniref:Secreted protein n=1 Tax=Globodera pallida TaxID=36090 RepID=A0A183C4A7_GLOPA